MLYDKSNNVLGSPGEWKIPSNLVGPEITMFELLSYPTLKSCSDKEATLRELGRQIYQSHNDPDTFNQAPETMESLTERLSNFLPLFHRHLLGHPDIRSNSENGRWEHRRNRYRGTFSQESLTVINPNGRTILQMNYKKGENTFKHWISSKDMVEFALILNLL